MPLVQLSFECAAAEAESVEAACFDAGALSVGLFDAAQAPIHEPAPGTTPLWPRLRVVAQFAEGRDAASIHASVTQFLARDPGPLQAATIDDRDWEREWLRYFRPMRFGARLWVRPHDAADPPAGDVVVRLDPGLAFGTGTHPTTAMCLEWLEGTDLHQRDVVDYGCGSGILAIAAVKLGAGSATGVDIDPQALTATRMNAFRNGVAERIRVIDADEPPPLADVLIANILANPLIELAPRFASLVRPRGALLLSGLLVTQGPAVALAFAPWFDMHPFAGRDDWVCLEGVRR
jgi:ribosomal protein L11 methyltransferase